MSYPVEDRRGARRLPDAAAPSRARRLAALCYGAGVRAAAAPWDLGVRTPRRVPWPVISVGSLTAGGAGKTPVVRWLAARLRESGFFPAILSRGYGSSGGSAVRVVDPTHPDARRDGDEPVLLARSLPGVPVVVGPDRVRGAELAAAQGARVLLLDDGFQHRRLHRDFDLVLWDARAAAAGGRLLPAGPLREPTRALRRADLVLCIDRGDGAPAPPLNVAAAATARLVTGSRQEIPHGTAVHAVSGIAGPESFERSLAASGLVLTGATRFADHHPFSPADVRDAGRRAEAQGAAVLATTAKDWMRWPRGAPDLPVPCVFDLDVEIERGELVLERIATLARGGPR